MKERILFVVILFFGIGIGFFGWKIWKSGSVRIQEPVFVEEWSKAVLRNAQNLEIPLNKIPGKLKLVYFGFSHCPDMCPRALMDMSLAIKELGEEGKNLTPVFISVDPERDSPELLAKYVKQFPEERLIALTGEKTNLDSLQNAFGVVSKKVSAPQLQGGYTVDHTVFIYVLDDQSRILMTFPGGTDGKTLAEGIRKFL
ncbi:SCO family protein [Leptospira mayottensis]|uniref:SCO1/SenC n=2 Tax=Leptospira mayottensis TaxID=1137606 RepID=A0AA87MR94_9LEPT|nr:SCO family protein [Leptospira mayottensis]AXR61738.1 SCO family protein [Leptospira mayottensis]AXR64964.1 SCO family protein [Leptospira mayottensis]AXR69321.1 SCO family protein [Leptospira mayottensis]AZQ01813.1 SCO family protein [Leptospira mayottensis 200901116]EKS00823.1 SCO1/SenC [Leptospira mayottensis 200901122]